MAARDIVLMVRGQLSEMFERVLRQSVAAQLSGDLLPQIILSLVEKWDPSPERTLEILVSEEEKQKIEQYLFSRMKEEYTQGVEVKAHDSLGHGFRIGIQGEQAYYDFTDASITEALKLLVNPRIAALLNAEEAGG